MSMLTLYLNFEKIPTVFDSLEQSSLIWFCQVRFESKVTPRYLTVETCLILTPSIFKLSNLLGFNFLEWKRTKFIFKILSANLLDFIHSATILSSLFSFDSRSSRFLHEWYILVSSANKWKVSSSGWFTNYACIPEISLSYLGISETRENYSTGFKMNNNLNGYTLFSQPSRSAAGGVVIYASKSLNAFKRTDLSTTDDIKIFLPLFIYRAIHLWRVWADIIVCKLTTTCARHWRQKIYNFAIVSVQHCSTCFPRKLQTALCMRPTLVN